jgi:hypothetical protein
VIINVLEVVFFKVHVNCFLALTTKQLPDNLGRPFQAQGQLKCSFPPTVLFSEELQDLLSDGTKNIEIFYELHWNLQTLLYATPS